MSSFLEIIQQLKDRQTTFDAKLSKIESLGVNINKSLLRDLIQDARGLHEASVILSYVLFDEKTQKNEQLEINLQENDFLSKDFEKVKVEDYTSDKNSVQKEPHEISEDIEAKNLDSDYSLEVGNEISMQEEIVDTLEREISSFISGVSPHPVFRNEEEEDNSLAAKLSRKKIENLSSGIGINEKFLFTNELFDGNTEHFLKTIEELNNCGSLNEAYTKLSAFAVKRSWLVEEEPYLKLQSLLSRKYQ